MAKKADKENKISSTKLQDYIEQNKPETFTIKLKLDGAEDLDINVKVRLSLTETVEFVREVVSGVVDKNTGIVSYELKNFLIRLYTIEHYTTNVRLPDNINKKWDVCFNTNLYTLITENDKIDTDFYCDLLRAVEEQIGYEVQVLLKKSKLDDLLDLVTGIVSKMDSNIDFTQIGDVLKKLENVGKLDEKKIVDAIADKLPKKEEASK